jgi:hypothetical protein
MAECIGRYHLALYTAGDLPADESAALKSHLDSCRECSASLDDLHKNVSEYERKASEHLAALKARLSEDSGSKERKTGRLWFTGISLAAAIAVSMLVIAVWPGDKPDEIAFKGAFSFQVVAQKKDEQIIVKEGEKLTKGDAIRFVVTTDSSGFVSVFSVDSRGRIFPFYPDSDPSAVPEPMRLERPGKHELPGSVFLDDWIGTEHLVVVFSQEVFDRKRVLETTRDTIRNNGIRALGPAVLGIEGTVGVVTIQKVEEHTP